MKYLFFPIVFVIFISCASDKSNDYAVNLIWEDNFKGSSLDTNFWNIYIGNGCPELCGFGNHELQYYTNGSSNLKVENGKLTISAYYDTVSNLFKSAKITTKNKVDFQGVPGFAESISSEEVRKNNFDLSPTKYIKRIFDENFSQKSVEIISSATSLKQKMEKLNILDAKILNLIDQINYPEER